MSPDSSSLADRGVNGNDRVVTTEMLPHLPARADGHPIADRSACVWGVERGEDLGVGVEDFNDRHAGRSFAVALGCGHGWVER